MQKTTNLPTIALGTTRNEITRVGFGAWAIGGGGWAFAWGDQDDDESIAAMRHAVERGVNWIDTAAVYGLGHSEELVGRCCTIYPAADRPLRVHQVRLDLERAGSDGVAQAHRPAGVAPREVERSLKRLGVEQIDLYQMHWPAEDGTPIEDYWQTLLDLKRRRQSPRRRPVEPQGRSPGDAPSASATSTRCSRRSRRSAATSSPPELPWCLGHDTGVIVYSPMQSGLLTGTFTEARAAALAKATGARARPSSSRRSLQNNLALADALRPIAARHGTTVGAIAIAWTLAVPGVTAAIVGARSPEQVDGWIAAATSTLGDRGSGSRSQSAIERTAAGTGPLE